MESAGQGNRKTSRQVLMRWTGVCIGKTQELGGGLQQYRKIRVGEKMMAEEQL